MKNNLKIYMKTPKSKKYKGNKYSTKFTQIINKKKINHVIKEVNKII